MPAFPNNTESLVKKTTAKTIRGPIGRLKCAEALVFRDILGLPPAAGDFVYQVYRVSQKTPFLNCRFVKPGLRVCDFHCHLRSQLAVEGHVPSNLVS